MLVFLQKKTVRNRTGAPLSPPPPLIFNSLPFLQPQFCHRCLLTSSQTPKYLIISLRSCSATSQGKPTYLSTCAAFFHHPLQHHSCYYSFFRTLFHHFPLPHLFHLEVRLIPPHSAAPIPSKYVLYLCEGVKSRDSGGRTNVRNCRLNRLYVLR